MSEQTKKEHTPDVVCKHGTAMDVHCCGCRRSGFFPPDDCSCCEGEESARSVRHRVIQAAYRPGPMCRDCADHDGRCPADNRLCDPFEAALEILRASEKRVQTSDTTLVLARALLELWQELRPQDCDEWLNDARALAKSVLAKEVIQ
jgi:hypothetical protein